MTLPVSRIVNVDVSMGAKAAANRNFGIALFLGQSDVIDAKERIRFYANATDVSQDFGVDSAEYLAAQSYFSQKPTPRSLYLGRWMKTPSSGSLKGAVLSTEQQALSKFTAVSDGSFKISIDGTSKAITAIDLSQALNLNGVASAITAKMTNAVMTWDAGYNRFIIKSNKSGLTSSVGYASSNTTGTDLSVLLGLVEGKASEPVVGQEAETVQQAIADCIDVSNHWYGLGVLDKTLTDDDIVKNAGIIEAAYPSRIYGITTQNSLAMDTTSSSDLPARLKALGYDRTFTIFSSNNQYGFASVFGRAFTVNFTGQNTTITLKFKQLPGTAAENIRSSQANALQAKNCNVFVEYDNDTAILQEGVMASGKFFDEVHGLDWLQNYVQTSVYNLLYTSNTKIPQTDGGVNREVSAIEHCFEQGVTNGLLAPGVWNGDELGTLESGDYLSKGYYVYASSVDDQAQQERELRKSPVKQCAVKLAGAIHFSDVIINVNR